VEINKMATPKLLTKSKYLLGLECPQYFWMSVHEPEIIRKATTAEEFRFEQGDKVGELAKTLFSDGIDIQAEDYLKNIAETKELLKKRKPLFEAGFEFENCFSRADILEPIGDDEWDIIEVKSGTKVKDINIHDVSFQRYVYEKNGLKIRKCFLLHTNNEYVRKGDLDINELFTKEDITSEVDKATEGIESRIDKLLKIISSDKPSDLGILIPKIFKEGHHDCLNDGCLNHLPENHVFCLYRGGKLSCELFENGIETIKDIPDHIELNGKQSIQRECDLKNQIYIEKPKIKEFLDTLEYPVYYFDFETFSTAIPMFDGLKPYSQVPFQFSIHVVEKPGAKPKHHEFLYDGNEDPRKELLQTLKETIGNKGSVVVYYQSFETGRLKEMAECFPENKEWIDNVLGRIVDLWAPFMKFYYYNPKQQGSASIKDVLPAITGKGYKGMEIGDGGTASVEFYRAAYESCPDKEKARIRENLLKYCELDTLGEVWIVEKLEECF